MDKKPTNPEMLPEKVSEGTLTKYLDIVAKNLTQDERRQFLEIALLNNLNPFKREVYAVKYGNTFNILTGYEVYLKRAQSNPNFDGMEVEVIENPRRAKVTVYRKDWSHPFVWEAYASECNNSRGVGAQMPLFMLRKTAISQALRMCFQDVLGGMPYTNEEMGVELDPRKEVVIQPEPPKTVSKPVETPKTAEPVAEAEVVEKPEEKKPEDAKTRKANFIKAMSELRERNPKIYDDYLETISCGTPETMRPVLYKSVYKSILQRIEEEEANNA